MSQLESLMTLHLRILRQERPAVPEPLAEYRFHPDRRWRFDFAWPAELLAIEVEGGTYTRGRHNRPVGFKNDCEKYNAAALLGWRVLRYTGAMIQAGQALEDLKGFWDDRK